jgi:hypothetical protein
MESLAERTAVSMDRIVVEIGEGPREKILWGVKQLGVCKSG